MIFFNSKNFFINALFRFFLFCFLLAPVVSGSAATTTTLQLRILSACGNHTIEPNEQCDTFDLNGETCVTRGFTGGTLSCNDNCTFNTSQCTSPVTGGSGGGGGTPPPPVTVTSTTGVIFTGRAYPFRVVTLLKDAQIVTTTVADADANFYIPAVAVSGGNYVFSFYSEDTKNVRSSLFTVPVTLATGTTTQISGVYVAPSILVDKSEVKHGEKVTLYGQTVPRSEVTIIIDDNEKSLSKMTADKNGLYQFVFDTTRIPLGQHYAKARSIIDGDISPFSTVINFSVGNKTVIAIPAASFLRCDVNHDKHVDLVDFSIEAYWYKKSGFPTNYDFNSDGRIDLVDFSIMAFFWTG